MATVKGTKEYRYRVAKYRPTFWAAVATALGALILASIQASYWIGYKNGMSGQEQAVSDLAAVSAQLKTAQLEQEAARQQLANIRLGSEVDKSALDVVRSEVAELKQQMASLQEENLFYRNLMAPTGNKRGLNFGAVEITQTDAPRTYRYKVVMQQLATQHDMLVGTLSFNVIGRLGGELRVFALKDLTKEIESTNIKLRFKYFQTIEGELKLPENFEPERIELEARSTGNNAVTVEKRFGWLVEEPI